MSTPLVDERLRWLERLLGRAADGLVPSPRPMGYRARIDLHVGPEGRLGYMRPRSHEHGPITEDPLARPEINAALASLPEDLRGLQRVQLRSDGQRVVARVTGSREVAARLPLPTALGDKPLHGDTTLSIEVCGVTHGVSPGSFYQVNLEVNEVLVAALRERVLALEPAGVLDLYAGIGNLSHPLAAAGVPVTQVEREGSSVADARATAKRHGLAVTLRPGPAERFKPGELFFDVAILDPPRAGAPGLMERLLVTRPRAVFYVSCQPQSLARDLRPATKAGYRLDELLAFDMFPGTPHLELLAVLRR